MLLKFITGVAIAYLMWRLWHGFGTRPAGTPIAPPRGPVSSEDEALAILGLRSGATEADIRAAHRRLLKDAHPDHGGTADRTRRINAARDTLMQRNS